MLQNGAIVADKYKILQKIGEGGMSTVYLAEDLNLNKKWTVKEIIKSGQEKKDQINLQSLIAEANLIKKIDHPAIPRIVDIIDTKSTVFIVRDFIDGEPMHQVIRIYGAQPENAVVEWAKQLCDVLNYLHHMSPKVIYRDMKPSNIMLMPDGSLRLIDFGIAQEVGKDDHDERMRTGTKGYAPTEQFRPDRKTDERSDIYALGMTLYQIATGISPASAGFDRNKPVCEQNPKISARLSKIIDKCIQENPDDRYQNCSELQYELGKIGSHDQPDRSGSYSNLKKIGKAACLILFFAFVALGLLSSPASETGGFLHWAIDDMLNCKNIYFLAGVLLLLFYMLLRENEHGRSRPSGEGLKAADNTIVVSNAQEGSMMDLLRTGADESGRFGRSMDTSEAVRYSILDSTDTHPAQNIGSGSDSIRPASVPDNVISNGNDLHSIIPSEVSLEDDVTQPLDTLLDETTVLQEDDTQFLDTLQEETPTAPQEDVTEFIDPFQDEMPTVPQEDVTQFLDPLQDEMPTAPQEDDMQFLDTLQDETPTVPQEDDMQFLDTLQEETPTVPQEDVTVFIDPLQKEIPAVPQEDVTQFLDLLQEESLATPQEDVTQFLDPLQEEIPPASQDDVTQFLDLLQEEMPAAPQEDVTQFLDPLQGEKTQRLTSLVPDKPDPFRILRREIVVNTDETII